MNNSEQLKFEFSQTGWRQSIAVNIAAQIIWVIVPIVFVSSVFLFNAIEKDQSTILSYKIDALNYRVSNIVLYNPQLTNAEKDTIINNIANELEFKAIEVIAPDYHLTNEAVPEGYTLVTRTSPITDKGSNFENLFIVINSYHLPLDQILNQKRKDILAVILLCLVIFAAFLVYSIRTRIYKPLKKLVKATELVAAGDNNVNLDTARNDEFGHLSLFFQHMLDNLVVQHDRLRAAAKAASEANSAKSAFLANMSHELRTPLNAIIGYSEMMLDEANDAEDQIYIDDLSKTISASKHLLHLINAVLDLSKIEAGKMDVHAEYIVIDELLKDIKATVDPLIRQRNNKFELVTNYDIDRMYSDSMKIRQILINLLGNACKFTENGLIALEVEQKDSNIEFRIKDTGIGIRKENLNMLFRPFIQEDNSSTRIYGGTGLGLTICRELANMLGGNIHADSTLGEGSCFTVVLPINIGVYDVPKQQHNSPISDISAAF